MESRVDPRAPVRRTRATAAPRDPTARVVDIRGDPIEGAQVRVFVGDWREGKVAGGNQQLERVNDAVGAYVQTPGLLTAQSGGDGSVTLPEIGEWSLRTSFDDRELANGDAIPRTVPKPVDPEVTNPYVMLVAEVEGPNATWFGATRARYHQLTGVSGPSEFTNAPPRVVIENRRLAEEWFGTPVGGKGRVLAWQSVADPAAPPEDIRSHHRVFIEVRAARREQIMIPGNGQTSFHTTDTVDQPTAQLFVGDDTAGPDGQHPLLQSGGIGVDLPEDGATAVDTSVSPGAGNVNFTPFVDDPIAGGPFSLAMAAGLEFDYHDWPYPVFPLVRNAFQTFTPRDPDDFTPPLLRGAEAFTKSFVKGLAGERYNAIGNALTLFQTTKYTIGSVTGLLPEGDPEEGKLIGDREPSPNEWDGYRTTWSSRSSELTARSSRIDECPFAVVHRLPIDILQDEAGADRVPVVLRGGWAAGLDDDQSQKRLHRLSREVTVIDRTTPTG